MLLLLLGLLQAGASVKLEVNDVAIFHDVVTTFLLVFTSSLAINQSINQSIINDQLFTIQYMPKSSDQLSE